MFSTSLATAALSGLLAAGSMATQPAWHSDYGKAVALAAEQKKPIAVFIASGGYGKAVATGTLAPEATKTLKESYVCLTVDPATPAGKELASAFGMTQGVVISSKAGTHQALRHEGAVAPADLTKYLSQYAAAPATPVRTEYVGASRPAYQPAYESAPSRPVLNAFNNVRNFAFRGG